MARKKKQIKETTIEDFYDLKSEEMDELVAALKSTEPDVEAEPITMDIAEITGEEVKSKSKKAKKFNPYHIDKLAFIPTWIKAIFIKWWFFGAVSYFVIMGISYTMDSLDQIVLTGVVLGIVVDVLLNPLYRMLNSDDNEYNNFIMFPFPFKAFWTFLTNILYYIIVAFGINAIYEFIGYFIYADVGIEPLGFATSAVAVDMIFIGIKDLIVYLIKRARNKNKEGITDV